MGVKITINNAQFKDNAKVLNNAKIHNSDSMEEVTLDGISVEGNAEILQNLEIGPLVAALEQQINRMDTSSKEYAAIRKIIENKNDSKEGLLKKIAKHMGEFTNGVLQNVVAECLMRL